MAEVSGPVAGGRRRAHAARGALALLVALAPLGCREAVPAEPLAASADAPLDDACDQAAWMVDEALGVDAEPAGEPVSDLLAEPGEEGCRLVGVGSFADLPEDAETPVDLLWSSFDESGWHEDPRFAADTRETSAMGMWKGGVLCVVGAAWEDPYAPDLPDALAEDDLLYDVTVECVPSEVPPIPVSGMIA